MCALLLYTSKMLKWSYWGFTYNYTQCPLGTRFGPGRHQTGCNTYSTRVAQFGTTQQKHRVTIPCKWSFEKRRLSQKAALFTNGLPSVLYETPGLNERSVLNQLFLMISGAFHMKSAMLFMKSTAFHEKCHFS